MLVCVVSGKPSRHSTFYALASGLNEASLIGDIFYVPVDDLLSTDMERYIKISDDSAQSFDDKDKVKTFVIEATVWSELE